MAGSPSPEIIAVWPDLYGGNVSISPPRNGMDRYTGKLLQGWDHVEQSLYYIFATPFHSRVLRRWIGSFVPPILGRNISAQTIGTFYWAVISAIDLWEPNYRITKIDFMQEVVPTLTPPTVEAMIRSGQALFRNNGVYYPRGFLGNFTPSVPKSTNIINIDPKG
jgi:uncharacterized protein